MFKLSVSNRNFLWMTRGKSWEFRFLSKCSSLSPVIDAVYKTVFLRDESRFGYWKGIISFDGRKWPYVACRCYDHTMQRDEAGRRIPHDFLLLCSDEEYNLISGLAWESLILDQVRGLYSERYSRCANEVTDCVIDFSVHVDSVIKPSNSCELLDVSVPTAISPTNRESISKKYVRAVLAIGGTVTIALLVAAIGSCSRGRGKGKTAGTENVVVRPSGGEALLRNGETNITPSKGAAETNEPTDGSRDGTIAPPSRLEPVKPALAVVTNAPTRTSAKANKLATSTIHNEEQNEHEKTKD